MALDPASVALGTAGLNFGSNLIGTWAARKTAKEMIGIEEGNLALQQGVFDYQQALQREIFAREDNSVQRRVEDLQKAGLSPVLAAGQGARAGQAIQVSAPQQGVKGQIAKQNAQMEFAARNANVGRTAAEAFLMAKQAEKIDSEIKRNKTLDLQTQQQTRLTAHQVERVIQETTYLKKTLNSRINVILQKSRQENFKTYVAQVNKRAAQVDSIFLQAAEEFLTGHKATWTNNKFLVDVATKDLAYQLMLQEQELKKVALEIGAMEIEEYESTGTQKSGMWGLVKGLMNIMDAWGQKQN